jgi:hypothetical protein
MFICISSPGILSWYLSTLSNTPRSLDFSWDGIHNSFMDIIRILYVKNPRQKKSLILRDFLLKTPYLSTKSINFSQLKMCSLVGGKTGLLAQSKYSGPTKCLKYQHRCLQFKLTCVLFARLPALMCRNYTETANIFSLEEGKLFIAVGISYLSSCCSWGYYTGY